MQLHFSVCNKYRLTYNAEIATETWRDPAIWGRVCNKPNAREREHVRTGAPPPCIGDILLNMLHNKTCIFYLVWILVRSHHINIFGTSFKTYILRLIIPLVSQLARSFTPVIILHVAGLNLFRSQQIALSLYWPHPLLLSGQNILHFTFVFNETYWRQPLPARP